MRAPCGLMMHQPEPTATTHICCAGHRAPIPALFGRPGRIQCLFSERFRIQGKG